MAVTKIIEVVGRSTTSSDDAVKSALAEAARSLRNIKALDVVSVGLRGDNMDEWRRAGAHLVPRREPQRLAEGEVPAGDRARK